MCLRADGYDQSGEEDLNWKTLRTERERVPGRFLVFSVHSALGVTFRRSLAGRHGGEALHFSASLQGMSMEHMKDRSSAVPDFWISWSRETVWGLAWGC